MSSQQPPSYGPPQPPPPPGDQPPYGPPGGQPPGGPLPPGQPPHGPPPPQGRKSNTGLIVGIIVAVLVIVGVVVASFLFLGGDDQKEDDSQSGATLQGDGYSYALPEGWADVTDEALQGNPPGAIDTVSAWGEEFSGAPANLIVEIGPASGSSDPEELRAGWESNMSAATGATPEEIDGRTIADEAAIGTEIRRTNENGVEIVQVAYLMLHDDQAYSIGLSTNVDNEDDARTELEDILASWEWS